MGGSRKEIPALAGQLGDMFHILPQLFIGAFQLFHDNVQPLCHRVQTVCQYTKFIRAVNSTLPGHIQIGHPLGDTTNLKNRPHQHPAT